MGRQAFFAAHGTASAYRRPLWCAAGVLNSLLMVALLTHTGCAPTVAFEEGVQSEGAVDNASADESDAGVLERVEPLDDNTLSNEAVVDLLRDKKYRGPGFRSVNAKPFPSTVSPEKTIALWVSEAAYAEFAQVSPDASGSNVVLPVGTVIVREVLNAGALETITVMAKLPKGAFPLGGDWWYAATSPDGQIRLDAKTQAPLAGLLQNCGTCHLRRSSDDFLFGTPEAYLP